MRPSSRRRGTVWVTAAWLGVAWASLSGESQAFEGAACSTYDTAYCHVDEVCDTGCGWDARGRCTRRPDVCAYSYEPVCGCDNVTYVNNCERLRAGVGLQYHGECGSGEPGHHPRPRPDLTGYTGPRPPCGGCGPEQVCNMAGCGAEAVGFCQLRPTTCGSEYNPVCGCNGVTYTNDCHRLRRGVPLRDYGVCVDAPPWDSPPDLTGYFGPYPSPCGACGPADVCNVTGCGRDATGYCMRRPPTCGAAFEPVCGCNGRTYHSDCHRIRQGVPFRNFGACSPETPVNPWDTLDLTGYFGPYPSPCGSCGPSDVCNISGCGPDATGYCHARPPVCDSRYEPVCGCNGVTYTNDCQRLRLGVPFRSYGPC